MFELDFFKKVTCIGRAREIERIHQAFHSGRRFVFITGSGGVGKTILTQHYMALYHAEYEIAKIIQCQELYSPEDYLTNFMHLKKGKKSLLIIDGLEYVNEGIQRKLLQQLVHLCNSNPSSNFIVVARNSSLLFTSHIQEKIQVLSYTLNLTDLSFPEACIFLNSLLSSDNINLNQNVYEHIYRISHGHPLMLTLFARTITNANLNESQILNIHPIYRNLIVDKNGNTISTSTNSSAIQKIKTHTIYVVENSMESLARFPHRMYDLTPRQFEEVIAELYQKCGYTVELTKQTRDGGKDIYLAHKNDIGTFLYLVQCKKYSKDHPVGVSVLREIYGVQTSEPQKPSGSIIATTSHFTRDAHNFIAERQLEYQMYLHDFDFISRLLREKY